MTTTLVTPTTGRGRVRQVIGDHPVAAMLTMMFTANFALLVPAAIAGLPLEPFLLGVTLIGYVLPAILVTAASGGRPAVRELFGRIFRWRVNPAWYLLALLGIPAATTVVVAVASGPAALHGLTAPAVILGYLNALSIFPIVNLWEETAWMGIVQSGLTARRGAVMAALITAPLFGLQHLALHIGEPVGHAATSMLLLMALAVPFRLMLGWLYSATGGSILLVAITHASFNATNNSAFLAHQSTLASQATWLVVAAAAVAIGVVTRGRFVKVAR